MTKINPEEVTDLIEIRLLEVFHLLDLIDAVDTENITVKVFNNEKLICKVGK